MKKLWRWLVGIAVAIAAGAAAIFAVVTLKAKRERAAKVRTILEDNARLREQRARETIERAHKEAENGWAADQEQKLKEAKDVADTLTDREFFERLRR